MRKFYIAGRYGRREEFLERAKELEKLGYICTSTWIGRHQDEDHPHHSRWAQEDIQDLTCADTLLAFTQDYKYDDLVLGKIARGGRHVELGMALALNMRIVVIGPRENVFCHLPGIAAFNDWNEFIHAVRFV